MKLLSISLGGGEIARAYLTRPMMTIGRAPSCDVVLRAPGISPVHFILEWAGTGSFDPKVFIWTITDVSQAVDSGSGEGILLQDGQPGTLGTVSFQFIEDKLESTPEIGGRIRQGLELGRQGEGELLELVQIRDDSGAVEQVLHLSRGRLRKVIRPLDKVREFKLAWADSQNPAAVIRVVAQEMPGAKITVWGQESDAGQSGTLGRRDMLKVEWRGRSFFLRLVPRVPVPAVRRKRIDPLLARVAGIAAVGVIVLTGWVKFMGASPELVDDVPPRIARIEEVKEEPPRPPAEMANAQQMPVEAEEPAVAPVSKVQKPSAASSRGGSSASRVRTPPSKNPRAGLNMAKKPTDINQVGILAALHQGGKKGPGVQADQVINGGIVTESVSSDHDTAPVMIKNPLTGMLSARGRKGGGSRPGPGLAGASTTLSAGKYDPSAVGALAGNGGSLNGSQFGNGSGNGGTGGPGSGNGLGDAMDGGGGGFSVEGGLDRETVRRVIRSYASQIRACYERSLLLKPGLQGRILYLWTISPLGPVVAANILESSVGSKTLDLCVLEVIRGMAFPKSKNGGATRVKYPFVFQPIH